MIAAAVLLLVQDRALVERWRESIELDLPGEVVEVALPLVTGDGALAKDSEAIALAARALAAAGEAERAVKLLEESRAEEGSRGFVEAARARLALDRDELAGARKLLLSESAVRYPAIPECWLLAGRALFRGGDGAGSVPLLERYLALAPLDAEAPSAWHMLAQTAAARGDAAVAESLRAQGLSSARWQAFHRTRRMQVREKPEEPLPHLGLVELYLAAGDLQRARRLAQALTKKSAAFCRGWLALAQAERGLGELAPARAACERAIACDGDLARAHLELARILRDQGEAEASAASYARYTASGGKEPL